MYALIQHGRYLVSKQPELADALIGIFSYEEMSQKSKEHHLPLHVLEQARKFGFAKYDTFEDFDCMSLEIQNFENVLIGQGSVVLYLEQKQAFFFTSKPQYIQHLLYDCSHSLGEKLSFTKIIYLFLEGQTKEEETAFDQIEKEILYLEQDLITSQKKNYVSQIITLRKKLMMMKRYYEQFLNVLDMILENENGIFDEKTLCSFRRLYKRTERSYQNVLNLRESVTQIRESYEAEVDINLNTTMKVFTVVTTIFLPLTLIAGWYGMNFQMPEYAWKHGYVFVIAISLLFIVGGIAFFKNKKWF